MANKTEVGDNVIVFSGGVELKKFSLYGDYAHRNAQKYIDRLDSDKEFLSSEIDRARKEKS